MTTTQAALVPAVAALDFDSFAVRQPIAGFLAGYGDATIGGDQGCLRRCLLPWSAAEAGVDRVCLSDPATGTLG